MRCVICDKPIKAKEPRTYADLNHRKRYACMACAEAFDALLDAHCPACSSNQWHECKSDGFTWMECDECGEKLVTENTAATT